MQRDIFYGVTFSAEAPPVALPSFCSPDTSLFVTLPPPGSMGGFVYMRFIWAPLLSPTEEEEGLLSDTETQRREEKPGNGSHLRKGMFLVKRLPKAGREKIRQTDFLSSYVITLYSSVNINHRVQIVNVIFFFLVFFLSPLSEFDLGAVEARVEPN